ncbi:MAG TPA: polymer-forming cytoskeletal protein [Terriglobales bacterium]|nr:polymer-forming cytoskeletal protein [Terriglobales bacterium]
MLQPKPTQPSQTPSIPTYNPVRTVTAPTEQGAIGRTIVIKGEVSGSEPLYIDGCIEGKIHFADHRVTIGRHGTVTANIDAKEVVIMGSVKGNIHCSDRVDIRAEGTLTGDVVTRRISVEDGAVLKGSVQVQSAEQRHEAKQEKSQMAQVGTEITGAEKPKALTAGAGA